MIDILDPDEAYDDRCIEEARENRAIESGKVHANQIQALKTTALLMDELNGPYRAERVSELTRRIQALVDDDHHLYWADPNFL